MQKQFSSLGEWMKERRKHLDLTQAELADQTGCSLEMVQKLESGTRRPSKQTAEVLAKALQIAPDELRAFLQLARGASSAETSPTGTETDTSMPVPHEARTTSSNLPLVLTKLLGREDEVSRVCTLFEVEGVRLVTLTGAPGIGKTRLSIEVARELSGTFDATFFVSLVAIEDARLVTSAIADALGIKLPAQGAPIEAIARFLGPMQALLVLDNFEHVMQAATTVTDLLSATDHLAILVTSREGLNLAGERQYPVPSLPLPELNTALWQDDIAMSPTVALFVERAVAVRPEFALTPATAGSVAAICSRLDGLPLAIELVAARMKFMSPQTLLQRLESGASLVAAVGGHRDAHSRHKTLNAAIEWSHDLLTPSEQVLFRRLSVFAGGCTLTAAEAVCNAHGDLQCETLDGIASLIDKSLIRLEEFRDGETRYSMLRVIREFALAKLNSSQDEESVRRLHAECFLALSEAAMPRMMKEDHPKWIALVEREMDNIRSAMQWLLDNEQAEMLMRFTGSMGPFCWVRGYIREGRAWTRASLDLADRLGLPPSRARSEALAAAGQYAWVQGEPHEAVARHTERLAVARQLGDKPAEAEALSFLGFAERDAGNIDRSITLANDSLALYRALGDEWGIANQLNVLGIVASAAGDTEAAMPLFRESLGLFLKVGDRWNASHPLTTLAGLAWRRGDTEEARHYFREALTLARESGYVRGIIGTLQTMVDLMVNAGEVKRALPFARAADTLGQTYGITLSTALRERYQAAKQRIEAALRDEVLPQEDINSPLDLDALIESI